MEVTKSTPAVSIAGSSLQIAIARDSDFVVQLTPVDPKPLTQSFANAAPRRARVVQFRVSRTVLSEHSSFFQNFLKSRPEATLVTFENKGSGFGYALEIWLRAIHNGAHTFPENLKATHIERVWVAIGVGEQFGFAPRHIDKLKPWFLECYRYSLDESPGLTPFVACSLAFPCSVFDHAQGFMRLTKYLAFNTNGSIFSQNPSNYCSLNQDARILDGPLTTARSHIQSVLENELSFPITKLHRATCSCRKETAFDYEDALRALDCWPVARAAQKYPIVEILEELEKFEFAPKTTDCESGVCLHNFRQSVQVAIRKTKGAFDGLCLDCMERSQVEHIDAETRQAYLEKNSPFKTFWDTKCRFGHGRVSWYYSWMGPSSVRRDILNKHREHLRAIHAANGRSDRADKRTVKKDTVPTNTLRAMTIKTGNAVNTGSSKENPVDSLKHDHEGEDDEEFFDAEDDA